MLWSGALHEKKLDPKAVTFEVLGLKPSLGQCRPKAQKMYEICQATNQEPWLQFSQTGPHLLQKDS